MKKTILIAAFVIAFITTSNAQRQNERRDYNREERTRQDDDKTDNKRDDNNRKDYENRNEKNRDKDYRNDGRRHDDNNRADNRNDNNNRKGYNGRDNNRQGRVEIYSRGYDYNRNYGMNDRYRHNWDFDYAPRDWSRDARTKIADGERRGLITNVESRRLRRELERVEQREYAYGSNGYFSRRERENLIDDIRDLNREISRQTRDNDYASRNSWYFRNGY